MSFGQRLRGLRREFDLSQAALGERAGCSFNTIRKIESDERRPSRELAQRLASVFELSQRERADFMRLARGTQSVGRASLPAPMTRLIGRESDVLAVRDRLLTPELRLLTLVGPPGVGKTRLALQVATDLQEQFRDGAVFVPLAAVRDPSLVIDMLAQSLGVRGTSSESLRDALIEYLRLRQLLVVLDNFEQVLAARDHVSSVLAQVPRVTLMVTSREALNVYGEHVYSVPTLGLPGAAPGPRSSSETLFLERARALRPNFASAPSDQPVVAEICTRLEGLPLAIELAASRARSMSPRLILDELSRRLDVLSAGPVDFSERQRSMRGALDWSYDLLSPAERDLFHRFAIFVGGATLDAVLAVCAPTSQSTAARNTVESLAEKSLITPAPPGDLTRLRMLAVIREYALESLESNADPLEVAAVHRRHAEYFADVADHAEAGLSGVDQITWLRRIEADHHNFRAALEWSLTAGDAALVGRLCSGLWPFWRARGYFHEGRRWLAAALALGEALPAGCCAAILNGAGVLAILQADYAPATAFLEQSHALYLQLADARGVAFALSNQGWLARDCQDIARAQALLDDSLRIRYEIGDRWGQAWSLNNLGVVAIDRGDLNAANTYLGASVSLFRDVGDAAGRLQALNNLGQVVQEKGDHALARQLFSESLALAQGLEHARGVASNLSDLALIALYSGDYARARDLFEDSLAAYTELGERRGIAGCLEGLAGVAGVEGRPVDAARLFGQAAALRESVGAPLLAADRSRYESTIAAAREQLDDVTWGQAWAEGQASSLDDVLATLR